MAEAELYSLDKMVAHIVLVCAHYNTNNMEAKTDIFFLISNIISICLSLDDNR